MAFAITAMVLLSTVAKADSLPPPAGAPALTVTGLITNTNQEGTAVFDIAMLEALPQVTIETKTIWTEGPQTFDGVYLADLLEITGAQGATLRATALNDYSVEWPVSDITDRAPIVAFRQNGKQMNRRGKGPLWIVYPFDADPVYRTETVFSRSIWQLDRLEIIE
jgi:hypothetical protein